MNAPNRAPRWLTPVLFFSLLPGCHSGTVDEPDDAGFAGSPAGSGGATGLGEGGARQDRTDRPSSGGSASDLPESSLGGAAPAETAGGLGGCGSTDCAVCPAGTSSELANGSACVPCAEGTFSEPAATSCTPHRVCAWAQIEAAPGTNTTDTVCARGSIYRQFGTAEADMAHDVARAPDGGAYVVGATSGVLAEGSTGSSDAFLRRYGPTGDVIWTRQFGSIEADSATSVAVDRHGHVIVLGNLQGLSESRNLGTFLRKFDADGNTLWQIEVSDGSQAERLAVDSHGNLFVAGVTMSALEGAPAGGKDVFVRKYDSNGEPVWARQVGSTGDDEVGGIAVSPEAHVVVVGSTAGDLSGPSLGGKDAFLWALRQDGQDDWAAQFGSAADDGASAVASRGGHTYVAGWTQGDLAAESGGEEDLFVREFDRNGLPLIALQFGGSSAELPTDVALDGARLHIVAGIRSTSEDGSAAADARVFTYANGRITPGRTLGSDAFDWPTGMALGRSGELFVVGSTLGALQGEQLGAGDAFVARFKALVEG